MATIHGNAVGIYVDAANGSDPDSALLVACSTNATLSLSNATIEASCKSDTTGTLSDSSTRHTVAGQQTWSMQVEGLVDLVSGGASVESFQDLFELAKNRTDILVVFSTRTGSNYEYYGSGFISSIEASAGVDDFVTYSCTIEGNGTLNSAAYGA